MTRRPAFSLKTVCQSHLDRRRRALTCVPAFCALALLSLQYQARAQSNTEADVVNTNTDLTAAATYSTNAVPGVTNDVVFTSGTAYNPANFTLGTSETFGSLNDLSTTPLTISNSGGAAADTLTLGGAGDLGDGVAGSNSADLLFVGTGANLTLTGGTGTTALGLVLGQSGNFDIAGAASISSIISDGGNAFSLTKTGAGTLTLTGANTYTGGTNLNAGQVTFTTGGLGTAGAITFTGNSILQFGAATTTDLSARLVFTNGVTGTIDTNGNNVTFATAFGGGTTGGLTKTGTGTLTLTGANTYTGGTNLNAGQVTFTTGGLGTAGAITFTGNSILQFGTATTTDLSARLVFTNGVTGTIDTNGNNVTFATAFGGSTTGALTKTGAGTLTLTGVNTYTGGTNLNAGQVTFTTGGLGTAGAITFTGNSILQFGTATTTDLSARLVFTNGVTGTIDTNGNNVTFATGFGGGTTGGLTKIGAGTLTLTGANTYTGTTEIDAGTLNLGGATANGSISASSALVLGGSTLAYTRTGTASQTFASTAINQGASAITESTNTQTLALGAITHATGGTLALTLGTATNAATTTTANGFGTGANAILNGYTTVGGTSWATSAGTGTVAGAITSFNSYTAASATAATDTGADVDVTGSVTVAAVTSPNSIRFNTGAFTLTLATGTNAIASGGILVGSGATSGTITGGTITAGTGNELFVVGSKAATIGSIIANNGNAVALTISDAGGVSLGAANTYTGNTYLNSGSVTFSSGTTPFGSGGTIYLGANGSASVASLISSNLSSTFTNPLTVEPGGRREIYTTVGGSPTYSGAITLIGGATLEAGPNSNSNLTLSGGATGTGNIILGPPQAGRTANVNFSGTSPISITGTLSDNDTLGGGSNTGTNTVSAPIQGATAVLQNSTTEQFILSGTNTYTGSTNVTAGTLEFAKPASTGASAISVASGAILGFNVDGNGGFTNGTSGFGTIDGILSGLSGQSGSTITYAAGSILGLDPTNGTNSTYSYAGNITTTPTTTLAKIGTGTLIFSGANSYSAATKINLGTLQFANAGAFSANSAITVASGAILGVSAGGTGEFDNTAGTTNGTIGGVFVGNGGQTGSTITYTAGSYVGIDPTDASGSSFTYSNTIGVTSGPGVAKIGTGTVILSGNNTYTTPTLVNTGTLQAGVTSVAGVSGAFGLNSAVTLANVSGATLALGGFDTQIGSLAGGGTTGGNVSLGANTLTTGGNNTSPTYSGVISGTGGLTKIGTGTQSLAGANTFTGATLVSNGILNLTSTTALNKSSSVTVTGSGLLGFGSGTGAGQSNGYLATGVPITGTGGIIDEQGNGNNSVTLNVANTYTGQTTWGNRGVTRAGIASAYDVNGNQTSGAFGVNSAVVFNTINQETLALGGFNTQVGSLAGQVNNGGGVQLLGATFTVGGDSTSTTYTGPISNNFINGGDTNTNGTNGQAAGGNLVKIGTGTQTFVNSTGTSDGGSSYEGTTTIKGGILSINQLGTSGFVDTSIVTTTTASATVGSTTGLVVGQYLYDTPAVPVGTTITAINTGTNTITLSANPSAAKTISNANFGFVSSIGISSNAAANLVLDGGTLQFTGAATTPTTANGNQTNGTTDRLFTLTANGGGLDASGTGALNFTNTGSLVASGMGARTLTLTGSNTGANTLAPIIVDGTMGSATSLAKAGLGTWVLTGANTYTGGTTVNAGILTSAVANGFGAGNVTVNPTGTSMTAADAATLNSTGSIASTAAVTVITNSPTAIGTVNFNGTAPTIGSLSGNGKVVLNNAAGTTLTLGGGAAGNLPSTFSGVISQGAATGNFATSTTGTVTLAGVNTYTGTTAVSAGSLRLSGAGSIAGTSGVTVATGLGGAAVATLEMNSTANSAVPITINATGVLQGNGTGMLGAVSTSAAGGTINPGFTAAGGASYGTITGGAVTTANMTVSSLTLTSTATYIVNLNAAGSSGTGTSGATLGASSLLVVNGAAGSLTLAGANLQVNDGGLAVTPGQIFKFISYTGTTGIGSSATGMFSVGGVPEADGATFMVGSNDYQISYSANDPFVELIAVPEPSTYAALFAGAGVLAYSQRRRFKGAARTAA